MLILLGTFDCHYGFPWDDHKATTLPRHFHEIRQDGDGLLQREEFSQVPKFLAALRHVFQEDFGGHHRASMFFFGEYILNLIQVSIFLILKH